MNDLSENTLQLESPTNLAAVRYEWIAERLGWCFAGVLLALALVGLAGPGYVSARTTNNQDGSLRVEYSALERYQAPAELVLHWRASADESDVVRIGISREFVDRTTSRSFVPSPEGSAASGELIVYTFRRVPSDNHGTIRFSYQHTAMGDQQYEIHFDDYSPVSLRQFVLP